MFSSLISDILFGFMGLISIINPFSGAFVFFDRTLSFTDEERRILSGRAREVISKGPEVGDDLLSAVAALLRRRDGGPAATI